MHKAILLSKGAGGNGPKHPLTLGEGLPIKTDTLGNCFPSENGQPKEARSEGFLLSRPVKCMVTSPLGKLYHDPELLCNGYILSNLLLTSPSVCLSAFHQNIITKQRKYQHLYSMRNTQYQAAELCSHPTTATSLLLISHAAQLAISSANFFSNYIVCFSFLLLCSLVCEQALHFSFHASTSSKLHM